MYKMTKTFGNEKGFSCCYRNPVAKSHCSLLHGYSLGFKFQLVCDSLDENGWVFDFGNFQKVKHVLTDLFDHTVLVSKTDEHLDRFRELDRLDIINLKIVNAVGCEAFAQIVYNLVKPNFSDRVELESISVFEHSANEATFYGL